MQFIANTGIGFLYIMLQSIDLTKAQFYTYKTANNAVTFTLYSAKVPGV